MPCSNPPSQLERRDLVSKMHLPRWLVSLFWDPEFDDQMRAYDDRQDARRLGSIQFRPVARQAGADHDRKPRFRLRSLHVR